MNDNKSSLLSLRSRSQLIAICFVASLAGCAAGPDFQRPAAPNISSYTTTPTPTQLTKDQKLVEGLLLETQWWRSLGSPSLNALIDDALQTSPTLTALNANLRQVH